MIALRVVGWILVALAAWLVVGAIVGVVVGSMLKASRRGGTP